MINCFSVNLSFIKRLILIAGILTLSLSGLAFGKEFAIITQGLISNADVERATASLNRLPGVISVKIDFNNQIAYITTSDNRTTELEAIRDLAALGYSAGFLPVKQPDIDLSKIKLKNLPDAKVARYGDGLSIFINGKPVGPMMFTNQGDGSSELWKTLNPDSPNLYLTVYYPKLPDFKSLDSMVAEILKKDPEAYILLRTHLRLPDNWAAKNSSQMVQIDNVPDLPDQYSLASEVWRNDMSDILVKMIEHIGNSDYGDRIIGYFIGAGATDEWGHYGWGVDRSPAMRKYFRKWLRERYSDNDNLLKKAWHNKEISFDTVEVPSRDEESRTGFGGFLNPETSQKMIDYWRCHNEVVADDITHFAGLVKRLTNRRAITGFFYGGLTTTHYCVSGTSAIRKAINSPDIDFLASPPPYENRGLGGNAPFRSVTDSYILHNKMYFLEADTRTLLDYQQYPDGAVQFGSPKDVKGTVELLRRDFSNTLIHGQNGWWFQDWKLFSYPGIKEEMANLQKLGKELNPLKKKSGEGIAFIIDEDSLYYSPQHVSYNLMHRGRIHEYDRTGTRNDYYLMDDLVAGKVPDYKLYVFLNAFVMDKNRLDAINKYIKKDNKTAVWVYAPGIINLDKKRQASFSNMKQLTGMEFEGRFDMLPGAFKIASGNILQKYGLNPGDNYGNFGRELFTGFPIGAPDFKHLKPQETLLNPHIYCTDSSTEVIGRYTTDNKPSFTIKKFPGWTSIYYGSTALTSDVLRAIARYAGVHIYDSNDDVVYSSDNLLMIHVDKGGKREISIPENKKVFDIFEQKELNSSFNRVTIDIPEKSTKLLLFK